MRRHQPEEMKRNAKRDERRGYENRRRQRENRTSDVPIIHPTANASVFSDVASDDDSAPESNDAEQYSDIQAETQFDCEA